MNSNGNRDYSAMTAFQDPASKMFSLYEQGESKGTLKAVKDGEGKAVRVDSEFIRKHQIPERTGV